MDIVIGALIGIISPIIVLLVGWIGPRLARATAGRITGRFRRVRSARRARAKLAAPLPQMGSQGMATWMQATLHAGNGQPESMPTAAGRLPPRQRLGALLPAGQRLGAPQPARQPLGAPKPARRRLGAPQVARQPGKPARVSHSGICPACGYHNSSSARFCRGCREELNTGA